jgi:hypothetical protein
MLTCGFRQGSFAVGLNPPGDFTPGLIHVTEWEIAAEQRSMQPMQFVGFHPREPIQVHRLPHLADELEFPVHSTTP